MTRKPQVLRLYVDTNVLVNYCTEKDNDKRALQRVFELRSKSVLFTSSLAVVQTITQLQSNRPNRKAYSTEKTLALLQPLLQNFTVLELTESDLNRSFLLTNKDLEDSVHYILCKKAKCEAILTNNVKDFSNFTDIYKILPQPYLVNKYLK